MGSRSVDWEQALRQARRIVELAPRSLDVRFLAADGWLKARRHIATSAYDTVVIGESPRRRRDRVALRISGWRNADVATMTQRAVRG
ncbi:MAG: hypothetical protein V7607_621 [Solirubrobacteraceae bacterium]